MKAYIPLAQGGDVKFLYCIWSNNFRLYDLIIWNIQACVYQYHSQFFMKKLYNVASWVILSYKPNVKTFFIRFNSFSPSNVRHYSKVGACITSRNAAQESMFADATAKTRRIFCDAIFWLGSTKNFQVITFNWEIPTSIKKCTVWEFQFWLE